MNMRHVVGLGYRMLDRVNLESPRPWKFHISALRWKFLRMSSSSSVTNEKLVGLLCSPYSATILVSNPQQGKLTIKSDLIFEEYIGLDLHEKLLMMEVNSNKIRAHGNKQPSSTYSMPKEIYMIEDNDDTAPQAPIEVLHIPNKSKRPSFNLLEEELDEVVFTEGIPAIDTEENGYEVITEQTVFDHIRKKAKNFPVLAPSKATDSSSSEALISTRKRTRENHLELQRVIEASEETERNKIPGETLVIPDSDSIEVEQRRNDINEDVAPKHHIISRSSSTLNLLEADTYSGIPAPETEENILKTITEETIFDHIRRKSKNFPVFAKSKTLESGALTLTRKRFCENQSELHNATDNWEETSARQIHGDSVIVPDSEPRQMEEHVFDTNEGAKVKHHIFFGGSSGRNGKLDLPLEVAGTSTDLTAIEMVSSAISTVKKHVWLAELGSSIDSSRKEQNCSNVSTAQCCSLKTTCENREVTPFLGFKSIFSFL